MSTTARLATLRRWIGQPVHLVIDRPLGSAHPRYPAIIYPVNYGEVPRSRAGDGAPWDAYVLGVDAPVRVFDGLCIAGLHRRDDVEDKLVVAPEGVRFSDDEIRAAVAFQERYFDSVLLR